MKRLPIGYATLEDMLDNNCLYIDKTKFIAEMLKGSKCYFLSRPRRFGKSLFVDTLKQAFLGNKKLFKGLYLENNWDWDTKYPVIHISFGGGSAYNSEALLLSIINQMLKQHAQKYEVELEFEDNYGTCFNGLIRSLYTKYNQKVVILVDEYDKPILDVIDNKELAITNREILKGLYSVIKDNDQYLKFVFLTGVSKFSKAGLFSGLNNLNDISLRSQYADICGYTQANIENELAPYMKAGNVDLEKLKKWYNGYNFLGTEEQRVYNPFDLLLFCDNDYIYDYYWFQTGAPSFLVKVLTQKHYYIPALENTLVDSTLLNTFDIDNIPFIALLFQTGYLTIDKVVNVNNAAINYKLKYPNLEVRVSLSAYLAQMGNTHENTSNNINDLRQIVHNNKFDQIGSLLSSHFASIPHQWYTNNNIKEYEGFYASIVYSLFCALGYELIAEDTTNMGRIDLTIKTPDKIVILEFKLGDDSASVALEQIKQRGYADKYKGLGLPIYLLGISFDPKMRNLTDYQWELV